MSLPLESLEHLKIFEEHKTCEAKSITQLTTTGITYPAANLPGGIGGTAQARGLPFANSATSTLEPGSLTVSGEKRWFLACRDV